jgi:osomolarity two-component system response regulator SKN7
MNDVLPKPFTKEGLLAMLEKHLSHLKKGNPPGIESMPPPLNSTKRSLKSEDSPATSPAAGSNWNSPNQITAGSPAGSNLGDDSYGLPTPSYPTHPVLHAPGTIMYAPPGSMIPHHTAAQRRPIDNISGGADMGGDVKRQQVYPAGPMGTMPSPMPPQMHRPSR